MPDTRGAGDNRRRRSVNATSTQNVLTPLLVAHPSNPAPYAGRHRRGVKDGTDPARGRTRCDLGAGASPTTATRRPRRSATRSTQARNVPLRVLRQQAQPACTSRLRSSRGPAFVMWPRWRRAAELSSRGPTRSRHSPGWRSRSASMSSTKVRNVSATIGPTPGTVCKRCTMGSLAAVESSRASTVPISSVSRSIVRRSGASVSRSQAGTSSASRRRPRRQTLLARGSR